MDWLSRFITHYGPALLLAGAAVMWYVASSAMSQSLARGAASPLRRALGHWIPIAICAGVAILARQPQIALGVVFATSVAALALVLGMVLLSADAPARASPARGFPVIESSDVQMLASPVVVMEASASTQTRAWVFVLPAALLALLAGFSGELRLTHAIALLLEGLVILLVWRGALDPPDFNPHQSARRRWIEIPLALALAVVAAWAGVRAVRDISDGFGLPSRLPLTAWLAAPGLVLPMIGSGIAAARRTSMNAVVSTSVGVVLLNLCVALPIVIGLSHVEPKLPLAVAQLLPTPQAPENETPATAPSANNPSLRALRYPISLWRVDTVLLIVLGLYLVPMAFGRWSPGRLDGVALLLAYLAYMWLTAWMGRR